MIILEVVLETCNTCKKPTKTIVVCDNCLQEIDYVNEIFHYRLQVSRSDPEGVAKFHFDFCNYKCMTEWMNNRTFDIDDKVEQNRIYRYHMTPYKWQDDSRERYENRNT